MRRHMIYAIMCLVVVMVLLVTIVALHYLTIKSGYKEINALFENTKCIDISDGMGKAFITMKDNADEDFINYMEEHGWKFYDQLGDDFVFSKGDDTQDNVIFTLDCKDYYMVFVREDP